MSLIFFCYIIINMTKKYLINYGGSLQIREDQVINIREDQIINIREDQIINFEVNTYIGDDNNIFLLNVNNKEIYDQNDNKIENLSNYNISVIPGDGEFIKKDGSLKINNFRHERCNGCTTYINKKMYNYQNKNEKILEKPYYPIDQDRFKICQIEKTTKLFPIRLVGRIKRIDYQKKYVDVSISDYYQLSNYC
jgi:hypothetical protein